MSRSIGSGLQLEIISRRQCLKDISELHLETENVFHITEADGQTACDIFKIKFDS